MKKSLIILALLSSFFFAPSAFAQPKSRICDSGLGAGQTHEHKTVTYQAGIG